MPASPAPSFEVRRAVPADLKQISILAGAMVRLHHELDPARFFIRPGVEKGYENWLGQELNNREAVVLTAAATAAPTAPGPAMGAPPASGGVRVLGYAYAGLIERDWMVLRDACGMLHDVVVDPSARRLGVGRALVHQALIEFGRLGAPQIVLNTAWLNEPARHFFAAVGFRPAMLEMIAPAPRT